MFVFVTHQGTIDRWISIRNVLVLSCHCSHSFDIQMTDACHMPRHCHVSYPQSTCAGAEGQTDQESEYAEGGGALEPAVEKQRRGVDDGGDDGGDDGDLRPHAQGQDHREEEDRPKRRHRHSGDRLDRAGKERRNYRVLAFSHLYKRVCLSIRPSHTSLISEKWAKFEQNSTRNKKVCHLKDYSKTSTQAALQRTHLLS